MPPLLVLVVATTVLGLALGSFVNVVAYRVPAGISVARPPSACPRCSRPIEARDNVPVLSWIALRGRCRHCSEPISLRYPAVELLTAVLFVLATLRLGWSWTLPAVLIFFAGLIALGACDLEHLLLPRKVVYPTGLMTATLLIVAAWATGEWGRLLIAVACGSVAFTIFYAVNALRPRWLGFGDVRLIAVIGLGLGWFGPLYLLVSILLANATGLIVIVALMAAGKAQRDTQIPYGVFLAAGAVLGILAGQPLVAALTVTR